MMAITKILLYVYKSTREELVMITDDEIPNPKGIVLWRINSNDINDVRGYNAADKLVWWLDSCKNFKTMYKNAELAGAPDAKFEIKSMDKRPPVISNN
jgi:hypothetical protein